MHFEGCNPKFVEEFKKRTEAISLAIDGHGVRQVLQKLTFDELIKILRSWQDYSREPDMHDMAMIELVSRDLTEEQKKVAGFEYSLSPSNKKNSRIIFCLKDKIKIREYKKLSGC